MKKIVIIVATAVICAVAVISICWYRPASSFGFYRVPVATKIALQKYVTNSRPELNCKFIDFDETVSLASQKKLLKKTDVLFLFDSIEATELPAFSSGKQTMPLNVLFSSVRGTGVTKNKDGTNCRYGIPILIDHLETDYHKKTFRFKNGNFYPSSFNALLTAAGAQKDTMQSPLLIAGGNDAQLLTYTGAVTEALYGGNFASKLCAMIADSATTFISDSDFVEVSNKIVTAGNTKASLDDVLKTFASAEITGILHSHWASMNYADVAAIMENQNAAVTIMPFSWHRAISPTVMEKYATLFIPAEKNTEMRQLTMPVLLATTPNGNRTNKDAIAIVSDILLAETQSTIAMASGLAPVHSTAEAADSQASDVRFWCAASVAVAKPWGNAICHGAPEEALLAKAIRNRINTLKMQLIHE